MCVGQSTESDENVLLPRTCRMAVALRCPEYILCFPIPFSTSRLLQWIVVSTTSGKSEAYRTLSGTRSGRGHRVNNGGHDLCAARAKPRYSLRPERRVTRLLAGVRARVNATCGRCFHHVLRAHFRLFIAIGGHRASPELRVSGAIQLRRCAATSCRRRAILSSKDRIGYIPVPEWPCAPVPCGTRAMLHWTRRPPCVTQMPPHESPCAGIHREESEAAPGV